MILLIAWFNYINLSTAQSLKRSVEVGVRKAIGAGSQSLITQFLVQSVLINLFSLLLAMGLVLVFQPIFNNLTGKTLEFSSIFQSPIWYLGLAGIFLGTLISGIYSSLLLSKFKTIDTMKGSVKQGKSGVALRKSLVVIQFAFSSALIFATIAIYAQLRFLQQKDLGIDIDRLLIISGPSIIAGDRAQRNEAFENELAALSFVEKMSISGSVPGKSYNFRTSGFTHPGSKVNDEFNSYAFVISGDNYFKTYDIPVTAGRAFTKAETAVEWNDNSKVMINEAALKYLHFNSAQEALNSGVQWDERHLDIIGVTADYHHLGLHRAIDPIIYYPATNHRYYAIKLAKGDLKTQIASLQELYASHFKGNPFDYSLAADDFAKDFDSDKQYGMVFTSASLLAIFIASLGLFGLALFTVQSRLKEIGVRKVLGAGIMSIMTLLSKDFLTLVVISLATALPMAAYFINVWLQEFPYHEQLQWWMFALAIFISITIAFITVSIQSLRGAVSNPSQTLKNE